jgi:hypothetical protein
VTLDGDGDRGGGNELAAILADFVSGRVLIQWHLHDRSFARISRT